MLNIVYQQVIHIINSLKILNVHNFLQGYEHIHSNSYSQSNQGQKANSPHAFHYHLSRLI